MKINICIRIIFSYHLFNFCLKFEKMRHQLSIKRGGASKNKKNCDFDQSTKIVNVIGYFFIINQKLRIFVIHSDSMKV